MTSTYETHDLRNPLRLLVPQDPCLPVQMALASTHPQAVAHDNHELSPHHAHRRFAQADFTGGGRLVSTLLHHKFLSPSRHAFLPQKGTDTANLQIINAIETAFNDRKSLNGSSWDIKRAFDLVSKSLIRLAWRRLGITRTLLSSLYCLTLTAKRSSAGNLRTRAGWKAESRDSLVLALPIQC